MIAAVYGRRSTEQNGADADARSVQRQIENARAFAAAKGWSVAGAHVYADDAVSGAELRKLRDRQRLLDVIRNGAPFQALIMRDASRFSAARRRRGLQRIEGACQSGRGDLVLSGWDTVQGTATSPRTSPALCARK